MKSESFYEGFRKCHEHKKGFIYHDDGYIFTPVSSPYLAAGQFKTKERKRQLSKFPDVCKFKPVEKRSIDFKIKRRKTYTFLIREIKEKLLFDKLKFSLDFREEIEGKIVEFFPVFTGKDVIMKPERIREDKKFPNDLEIASELAQFLHRI